MRLIKAEKFVQSGSRTRGPWKMSLQSVGWAESERRPWKCSTTDWRIRSACDCPAGSAACDVRRRTSGATVWRHPESAQFWRLSKTCIQISKISTSIRVSWTNWLVNCLFQAAVYVYTMLALMLYTKGRRLVGPWLYHALKYVFNNPWSPPDVEIEFLNKHTFE